MNNVPLLPQPPRWPEPESPLDPGRFKGALSRYKLQVSDAVIGPLNDDGSVPHGTFRGWLPDTINDWNANRPGQGARTDITQPAHPRMAGPLLTP